MPKIDIDYEVLDGIVRVGLKELLNTMIDGYRTANNEADKKGYADDIKAIEHVLKVYE